VTTYSCKGLTLGLLLTGKSPSVGCKYAIISMVVLDQYSM